MADGGLGPEREAGLYDPTLSNVEIRWEFIVGVSLGSLTATSVCIFWCGCWNIFVRPPFSVGAYS